MTAIWQTHARALAGAVSHAGSRWYPVLAGVPRHLFTPAWWQRSEGGWVLRRGQVADAYRDQTLVTRVGTLHADQATKQTRPKGRATSSSTLPSLVISMYRYGQLKEGVDILDVGTGPGYGAALLARRYGDRRVTTVDIDPYHVTAAAMRMEKIGLHPTVIPTDATKPLPGSYDRIISMMSVRSIPLSWLAALRPGGRLVTTITDTHMILTVTRTDTGVIGQIEWAAAGFMPARTGPDYPALPAGLDLSATWEGEVTTGRYPVVNIGAAWDLSTMLTLAAPGVRRQYREHQGRRVAFLSHPDGSWARATATGDEPPTVHQAGPQRLWDVFDGTRDAWLRRGTAPWLGARARIEPDGSIRLDRAGWQATIPADHS
ncbi:methyltransferase domain-containing protein [Candidatus Frankia nodulisporulans]|uniref:methyltransferase domain-containing protein n=1 Tax=Candidatus Frankia nodulisporulans TaxID=2060052 RepID=UPI0013D0B52D|nr:methyltransferase domain-containing protein [Candidatus Frankia nodulisporulans]